ncbi:SbcC/MukB-like Walker B domain-containing protein [Prauserella flavalba]|uniref:SbcC/MukB-like Walker B domain-containing protein n=1 Tax=Prauserella flavalba TaxID=1477506 RepID=UPI0036E2B341
MSVTEHPAQHLSAVAAVETVGLPGVAGRWQPTRAGVVNSWAWGEENLLFADGWLALTGPNGSGKSLTASMLVTLLLDADSSQTALSVSGKAAGTLTSRHTDWNDKDDRTGAWWLEYGLRDEQAGHTVYLTTGLWLRATSGTLHRAFFIAPGRVGTELTLQRERDPVRIEDLAEQLATCDGELFTSSAKLRAKSLGQLRAVEDERGYRQAIRSRLFSPLDEVQFDALVGVLRSLRSLRTAEAISPKQMREVLTDALPALDPERLTVIAEAMERIAELEAQLQRNREETKLLEGTDKLYRRYVGTVTQVEAAELTAANTEFKAQADRTREETARLQAAQAEQAEAKEQHATTRTQISELEGRRDAADTALRDHAGAELPHMEQRAADLAKAADEADERAEQAERDADTALQQASESADSATQNQQHLIRLSDDLRGPSTSVGADAALEHLFAATRQLASAEPGTTPMVEVGQVCATPLAWTEARITQVGQVGEALRGHELAQQAERSAAETVRSAEDEEDNRRGLAEDATAQRRDIEAALVEKIATWASGARYFGLVPEELTAPIDNVPAGDRLEPDRLAAWLESSASAVRARIDLPGHQQAAATDAALATTAADAAERARTEHGEAQTKASEAANAFDVAQEQAAVEMQAAEHERAQAHATYQESVATAQATLADSKQRLTDGVASAARAADHWLGQVRQWRSTLTHLAADAVPVPHLGEIDSAAVENAVAELDRLDPAAIRLAAERAHSAATTRLERRVSAAEQQVERAADAVAAIEAKLVEARHAAPVPTAPPWRNRQPADGMPLWALVDFAEHVSAADANRLEGALLVAGLLDALVTPDGRVYAGDLTITGTEPAAGRTLADMLRVEQDPGIDVTRITQLLRAIPVDATGSDLALGQLTTGVLTAAAPDGYEAAFIGRTARERARLQRVATLEQELQAAQDQLHQFEQEVSNYRDDLRAADAERQTFPTDEAMRRAREHVTTLWRDLEAVERETTERIGQADLALHQALADLETAAAARKARLDTVEQELRHAERIAEDLKSKAEDAERTAAQRKETAQRSEAARAQAATAQEQADAERAAFPDLAPVRAAHMAEDRAADDLNRARGALIEATEKHRQASNTVKDALRELNQAAKLPDGSLLPTDQETLNEHGKTLNQLTHKIEGWRHAAQRALDLLRRASRDAEAAAGWANRSSRAKDEAEKTRLAATREAAAVAERRRLYGAEYEQLRRTRQEIGEELRKANERAEELVAQQQAASNEAAAAQSTLDGIAPQREAAEQRREECLRQLCRLVDEGLATVPEDVATEPSGRPANLTAGLAWAKHLLADRPAGADRVGMLTQARSRALTALENSARTVSTKLARFGKQVTLNSIEATEWRRAVVAEPDAIRGDDLHLAVQALHTTAAQLEEDLRDDVKRTLKTSMFTQLRRDIQVRREAAQELVRQIRATLDAVRTGVANVGVQVEWTVREDEDAQRMVELISQPPSDETFEQMYSVLRQRMDETAGEAWAERVAHTFDYRAWHEWHISVTHSSFGDGSGEKFRTVTSRSNPLESLSTGERRLATMLPLLAAAWSMYSGEGYRGPRLLSIDEIDAAFDEPNLRQVLALLRAWEFDVLATAPFMTPMIKKESQRVMVHQVVKAGRYRVSVPWLWEGQGEPQPLTLELASEQTAEGR